MLGIGRFSGRAAAAIIVVVILLFLFLVVLLGASQRELPGITREMADFSFGGNLAAPGADFR